MNRRNGRYRNEAGGRSGKTAALRTAPRPAAAPERSGEGVQAGEAQLFQGVQGGRPPAERAG